MRSGIEPQPSGQAGMRRANLSLVLRHLQTRGPMSRASVAAEVGLNKATVSSLVAELIERELITEGHVQRQGTVGRPGQLLHVAGGGVVGVGAAVNAAFLAVVARDLAGHTVAERRVAHDIAAAGPVRSVALLGRAVLEVLGTVERQGYDVAGVTVAVPGLVDMHRGMVRVAPNIEWSDLALVDLLQSRLRRPGLVVEVGNDANLGAIAEHACGVAAGTPDLVYLSGETGVGGGIIIDGQLIRGSVGFSGEVGHMPLGDPRLTCGCGRMGCWETVVGLGALFRSAARSPVDDLLDMGIDVDARLALLGRRARDGDPATLAALDAVGDSLGRGASVLVNLVNPGALVLGGYFGILGWHFSPRVAQGLDQHVIAPDVGGCAVHASTLGFAAPSIGGAIVSLRRVLDDPTLVPLASVAPESATA